MNDYGLKWTKINSESSRTFVKVPKIVVLSGYNCKWLSYKDITEYRNSLFSKSLIFLKIQF